MLDVKIKPLTKEQIIISVDRLTRFKETELKYYRVFSEIILSNLLEPKYKKSDLEKMSYRQVKNLAQEIINFSLEKLGIELGQDYSINQKLLDYEHSIFILSDEVKSFLKNKINYRAILQLIPEDASKNLQWLKALSHSDDIKKVRANKSFCFPIEKLLLVEGITEETLLPEFAKLCDFDFDKNGVHVISAGGKNQVVRYFYNLINTCRLPIFVLLDKDANENLSEILPKLREGDRVHIIKAGEFEDVLPEALVLRTLDYATKNISLAPTDEVELNGSRVEYLEKYFKHRGLHEFKKAEFAELIKQNIIGKNDLSDEILEIFSELRQNALLKELGSV